jgi:hypothetical protein
LVYPQAICVKRSCKYFSLQIMIFVYDCATWITVELKTCCDTWITSNDVNGVCLFKLSYLITLMAYLCSHWTPKVQINYLKFDWSIYRLFVLNRDFKLVSLKIMIFAYICLSRGIAELKTRFETWITKNDVNGVTLFNISYLITIMASLAHNGLQVSKINDVNWVRLYHLPYLIILWAYLCSQKTLNV